MSNFIMLDKTLLNDTELSWGALGLYCFICSFEDNYDFQLSDFNSIDNEMLIIYLEELKSKGYLLLADSDKYP